MRFRLLKTLVFCLLTTFVGRYAYAQQEFSTRYFRIRIDQKGWITSMKSVGKTAREFSPADKPSPVLSLYDSEKQQYYQPTKAIYRKAKKTFALEFPNGSVATVSLVAQPKYFKLTLESLEPRNGIDAIQWGSYHTNITNLFGEIIGVARDTSEAVNYAIGLLALNDNTLGGTAATIGDAAPFEYMVHSPDPKKFPLPSDLHEGQVFSIGGDGHSDVAFYAHKEPYYRILYGNAAQIDRKGQVSVSYSSRDREHKREILFSLIPHMSANTPNHLEVQPLAGVNYIGSSVALWGSPDSTALLDVIQTIVKAEKLPYPVYNGKWVKDPAAFLPDAMSAGMQYDSIVSYTRQLGFKTISLYDQGFIRPDRGNDGYIDGRNFEKKPIKLSSGNISHKELSALAGKHGILIGRTPITNALAPGTKDVSPVPSDSIWYQQKRLLVKAINAADTMIYVNDPRYLEEIASWEGHSQNLNIIKIGKELIHYLGVSAEAPYRLLKVKRGYWKTNATAHAAGDTLYKLQVTVGGGYDGLVGNMQLQDQIAELYAKIAYVNGLGYYDFDGQEFLFNNGHGYYSAKRFFGKMFEKGKELGVPYIRFTGATLSEGSWHYQSIWNVGGGKNLYDAQTREWGSTTSQGKDLRDVTYANFFPTGMGGNFPIHPKSTVAEYEHVQAVSVGIGSTYSMRLSQKDVEACPLKYAIFRTIRTWENARAADAFNRQLKKELVNPANQFHLEQVDASTWKLYKTNLDGSNPRLYRTVRRGDGVIRF